MITRPLDLASRLKPAPRGLDALFYVNVGGLAVFFVVFGSRFVLAPGLAVDFALPQADRAATATLTTDVVIAVPASNMAVVDGAVVDFQGLGEWLRGQAGEAGGVVGAAAGATTATSVENERNTAGAPRKRLLVQASGALPARDLTQIYALAAEAGFAGVLIATDEASEARR
jgi:biopolymer transport protein ExbD